MARPRLALHSLVTLAGAIVVSALGWLAAEQGILGPAVRASYDLPLVFRSARAVPDVAIVYLDEANAAELGQPPGGAWDRRIHARLLERLQQEGARGVCFDIVFFEPSPDPEADAIFARAIAENGRVFLGANFLAREQPSGQGQAVAEARIQPSLPMLRSAAAGWGLLIFELDADQAVRRLTSGFEERRNVSWVAAGVALPEPAREPGGRWLNYLGPAGTITSYGIAQVLRPDGVPAGFFRDRFVFVGGRYTTASLQAGKDEFGNPYSVRRGEKLMPGVEIHATAYANLLHGDWLRRLAPATERWILALVGFFVAVGLSLVRPPWTIAPALAGAALALGLGCWLAWTQGLWFPWAVVAAVQVPVALAVAVCAHYLLESHRRRELRRAFGLYLSPSMADQIANSDFDLRPGGRMVEATVMFTDLADFTTLSETLTPEELSQLLIAYFTNTTESILAHRGTIIKYIGDAVMATWGAPLPDPGQRLNAIQAAWLLGQASTREVGGRRLFTRVGVSTGPVLAGNLGSPFRFDYTVIGDTTNLASRLEGMNKFLGTQILLAENTAEGAGSEFRTRLLGRFLVKGKKQAIALHELLGPTETTPAEAWHALFAEGVSAFGAGDFDRAERALRETIAARAGTDGPAAFYLRQLPAARAGQHPAGIIKMDEK